MHRVFPTLVGVFPRLRSFLGDWYRLPHARGGVSAFDLDNATGDRVFPTLVGVFPGLAGP